MEATLEAEDQRTQKEQKLKRHRKHKNKTEEKKKNTDKPQCSLSDNKGGGRGASEGCSSAANARCTLTKPCASATKTGQTCRQDNKITRGK